MALLSGKTRDLKDRKAMGAQQRRARSVGSLPLLAAVLAAAQQGVVAPRPQDIDIPIVNVQGVSFDKGSCNGGQRLATTGSGFATNFHDSSNVVSLGSDALGWRECDVVQGACTVDCGSATRIVCDTPKFPDVHTAKTLSLKVAVQKASADTHTLTNAFTCDSPVHSTLTPTVLGVAPRHVSANWAVNITGSRFGSNIKDYRVTYIGTGRPPSGGNVNGAASALNTTQAKHAICRPQSLNRGVKPGEEKQVHTQVVMQEDYSTLEIWEDFFRCELGDFAAGSYTVSVHLPYGLAWDNAQISAGLFSRDAKGTPYELQYFPTVKSIHPKLGSIAGGTTVTIRGGGFSMDDDDNVVFVGGIACRVITATLEEIQCITQAGTDVSPRDVAPGPPPTPPPSVTITLPVAEAQAHGGPPAAVMISDAMAVSVDSSFAADSNARKGQGWTIYAPAIEVSGTYAVSMLVPGNGQCAPRATGVPVVVQHSESAANHHSVVYIDTLDHGAAGGTVALGSFYFAANSTARVTIDNTGTAGCVVTGTVTFVLVSTTSATGCTWPLAENYDPAAVTDDESCLFIGGRGLVRQSWSLMNFSHRIETAVASELSLAEKSFNTETPCPKPGQEEGWTFLSGALANTTAAANYPAADYDCGVDCPSHWACPEEAFCCLTPGPGCTVPLPAPARPCTSVTALADAAACEAVDGGGVCRYRPVNGSRPASCTLQESPPPAVDKAGWLKIFGQDVTGSVADGFFAAGELRKYTDQAYSALDQMEKYVGHNGLLQLKLTYPGTDLDDVVWEQAPVPMNGPSLTEYTDFSFTFGEFITRVVGPTSKPFQ